MKLFSGFPPGKLQITPLPNVFFSELLPGITDLAELKLTLHLFWLFAQRAKAERTGDPKSRAPYVRTDDLRADRTLMRSLAATQGAAAETLERALTAAVERGTLLCLRREDESLYFLNSDAGRRAFERLESSEDKFAPDASTREPAQIDARPNVFALYEQNIGLLTPMISDELREAEKQYPADWITDAFRIAVENNKRSWSYIRKILERWRTEGRAAGQKKGRPWYGDEYGKLVKR